MSPPRQVTWKTSSSGNRAVAVAPSPPQGARPNLARGADRLDPRQPEVPDQIRGAERGGEPAAGAVDVDVDVEAGAGLEVVERGGDVGHRLVDPRVGHAERRDDTDRVLVDLAEHRLRIEAQATGGHPDLAQLDVPVAGELVPHDLHRAAHQVGGVGRLALGPASVAPVGAWPCRRACTPRTIRWPRCRRRRGSRVRSTDPRACARSAARSRRPSGTRPCRSGSC